MSLPATKIRPFSGDSSLLRRRSIVDFPEPDGPTRKKNSPFWMSARASRSATTSPLYALVTFSSLIMGGSWVQRVCRATVDLAWGREGGRFASARFVAEVTSDHLAF